MDRIRWDFSFKLLGAIAMSSLLLSNLAAARAKGESAPVPAGDASYYYYYADGRRIHLTPSLDWVSVRFSSGDPVERSAALAGSMLGPLDQARHIQFPELTLVPVRQEVEHKALIEGITLLRAHRDGILDVNPVFQTPGAEVAISDQFIAAFPDGMNMQDINAVNASHGVQMVEPILGQSNTFVLRVRPGAKMDALSMANLYQESGVAVHAAPNFVRLVDMGPASVRHKDAPIGPMAGTNDFWYYDQWYLDETSQYGSFMDAADADIDAPQAWDVTTGVSSVIIAIIDEGVDLTHEDLSGKLVAGYDATGLNSGGAPAGDDAHGTNVAGIAAASSDNGLGISGVCRECRIMPVRIAYTDGSGSGVWIYTDSGIANGITWAYQHGAAILNSSWGGGPEATVINTAISNAKNLGRQGMGSVLIFSAGNENSSVLYPAYRSDVIAVGATNLCDQRKSPTADNCNAGEYWWGSNYGASLDISAPGVWLDSTDIMGENGRSLDNYFLTMNGTSGAAPIVSGVAGLILSLNPYLTANEVQSILQSTADDIDSPGWDQYTGYGRVNANTAVNAVVPQIFADVPTSHPFWSYIEGFYNAGITTGCATSPLKYCPGSPVSRASMAVFILRAKYGPGHVPDPASTGIFADLPVLGKEWMQPWVEEFYEEGVTTGCAADPLGYCPESAVTRGSMAVFLLRAKYGLTYVPPPATGLFADVPAPGKEWMQPWIEAFYNEGYTTGCADAPLRYCPENAVTRGSMAVFLSRVFDFP